MYLKKESLIIIFKIPLQHVMYDVGEQLMSDIYNFFNNVMMNLKN